MIVGGRVFTNDDYDILFTAQGSVCFVCELPPVDGKRLYVDHDHGTGEVRGLLCHGCNAIAHKGAGPKILRRAALYVEGKLVHPVLAEMRLRPVDNAA